MNSDRGASQLQFDFGDEGETKPLAKLLRQEPTDPAHVDQPSLSASPADAIDGAGCRYGKPRTRVATGQTESGSGTDRRLVADLTA